MAPSPLRAICVGLLGALLLGADAPAATACVGDCDGNGRVDVAELIVGVRIGLGEAALSACAAFDANGDGAVEIDELVRAVAAALGGCPAAPTPTASGSPTPSPTPTRTATPVDTLAPTPTPTPPMVAGRWREDPLAVTGSTCIALVTQQFADSLASTPPCEQTVLVTDPPRAALLDCTGRQIDGTVDPDGTLHFTYPTTRSTTGGCTVALTASVGIPAAVSPTAAAYTFAVAFSGSCPLADCVIAAQGIWTRE